MVKKLMILIAMLAATLLATAVPALAQQETTVPVGVQEGAKTITFDLTVEGTPPADATFFATTVQGSSVQLTDPDGDGVYTGSLALSPQSFPEGAPLKIVQGTGTSTGEGGLPVAGQPGSTIKDFGLVPVNEDKTLSASVSFPDNGGSTTPESTTPESTQGGDTTGQQQDRTATLSFALTVKGDPPAGTTFLGFIPAEGGISAPLTDPDGDGVFTGSVDVPKFPPGPAPSGTEPVSLPVQIAQNTGGNIQVIKDFGLVKIDGDKTFSARVNFNKGDQGGSTTPESTTPGTTTPESTTPDTTTPATGTGGSDNGNSGSGGSDNGGSSTGNSGAAGSVNGGSDSGNSVSGSGSGGSDDNGNSVSGSGSGSSGGSGDGGSGKTGGSSSGPGGIKSLPATGGVTLATLGVGALLIGGGLLIRKISR